MRNRLESLRSDNRRRNARMAELRRQRKERARRRLQLQIRQQELLNHHSQMELDAEVARAQLQDDDDLTETEAEVAREMEFHGLADPDDSADEECVTVAGPQISERSHQVQPQTSTLSLCENNVNDNSTVRTDRLSLIAAERDSSQPEHTSHVSASSPVRPVGWKILPACRSRPTTPLPSTPGSDAYSDSSSRTLSPTPQSPLPESRQDTAEDSWDESGESVGEGGPVPLPQSLPLKTRRRAPRKGVITKVSPSPKHLDEASLQLVLGKFLEYPVVQVFINLLEPALQLFMIQDLNATMEKHCDTWKDFDKLLSRMMPIATEWNVEEHLNPMQPPSTRSTARARVTRSWNDFQHDGSPQETSVFPNSHVTRFNYTRILTDAGGKRVDSSLIFKAFLRTKYATVDPCIMHRQLIVLRCNFTDECSGCGARLSDFQNPKFTVDYHNNIDDTRMRRQMKKGKVGIKEIWGG